jgi:AcrR family transcriptional regulator
LKEKIIQRAGELFITYGFKSVTMDDIANEMAISKKTIYQHFSNKTKLVETITMHLFTKITEEIDCLCALEKNPIEEIYEIKKLIMEHLKGEKSSPQYQLQKYYPKIYNTLKTKQFEVMRDCVVENLERGIKQGLYRETIHIEFVARIYFSGVLSVKDKDLFPVEMFPTNNLLENYLEYHIRGIVTNKGLSKLNQIIKNNSENE